MLRKLFVPVSAATLLLGTLGAAPALAGSNKDLCKDGGYTQYTDTAGQPFKNQGQCVAYVNHGGALVPVGGTDSGSTSAGVVWGSADFGGVIWGNADFGGVVWGN